MLYYGYIYLILNKINNKIYVGQTTKNFKKRKLQHINKLDNNKHINNHLQNSWNKYGEENFEFILLHELIFDNEEDRKRMLDLIEKIYIAGWNLLDNRYGYNISSGGSNGNAYAGKSEEEMNIIKQKISKARKDWWENATEEQIKILKEKWVNRPTWLGKNHTEETKQKMKENHANVNGKNNPFYGKNHTEETKQKMHNQGSKKIAMIDKSTNRIIKVFESIADASEEMCNDRNNTSIGKCLGSNINSTAFGYKWRYLDDSENIIFHEQDEVILDKKIVMIDKDTNEIIKVFESIADASEEMIGKRKGSSIDKCLKNKQKTAYGYKWEWR